MKTYTKENFHNPEQLTRQQVGREHRLLTLSETEKPTGFYDVWCDWQNSWLLRCDSMLLTATYRVPLATPLPDGTVLSSNECCWSDEPCMSDEDHFDMMNSARISQSLPPDYLDAILDAAKKQSESLKKRTLYLAGKMSGEPDFAFPVFYAAAEKLERQGWLVVNPAQMDLDVGYPLERLKALTPDEFQVFLKGAMKRDLDALQQCDAIALLPGWERSKGARAEKAVAEWLGLEVMYLPGALNFERLLKHGAKPYLSYSDEPSETKDSKEEVWEDSRFACSNAPTYAPDDPKGAAGALKAPMWLLPPDALEEIAKVMGFGAYTSGYGPWNFIETTVCASTYISAIGRHLAAFLKGIDIDGGPKGSGLSHLSHIAANCMILLTAQQQGTLRDDRPKLRQI